MLFNDNLLYNYRVGRLFCKLIRSCYAFLENKLSILKVSYLNSDMFFGIIFMFVR